MIGLLTSLISGAITPLIDNLKDSSARLLRKAALFVVAALCLNAALIALTVAFFFWVSSHAGPIAGALAVAGLYAFIGILAIIVALSDRPKKLPRPAATQPRPALSTPIDPATEDDPVAVFLRQSGMSREQIALLMSAFVAKRAGPFPMVVGAIVVGFLSGRFWKSLRTFLEEGIVLMPILKKLFDEFQPPPPPPPPDTPQV